MSPTFWQDKKEADKIINELNDLKEVIDNLSELKNKKTEYSDMVTLLEEEPDQELLESLASDVSSLTKYLSKSRIRLLLNNEYDKSDCIMELHSGAGGTEACDWTLMLYRMYTRYCEKKNYKVEVLEYLEGEEAGLKSATLLIKGKYAYGYLKSEKGVHRLVRLSPFDSAKRRHTSFASVLVTPYLDQNIEVNINENDLRIDVYRSSGAGGQHVNTTDSAVRITHIPTGIVVTCQNERSQIQNREKAMSILQNKLRLLEKEKQESLNNSLVGEQKNIEFGSQIRSYVLHPYSLVKDTRTGYETSNVSKFLDGDLDDVIEAYLKGGEKSES